jgi:hypothetical protein
MAFPATFTNAQDGVTEIIAAHINNLETKVGIDSSADATSLDYFKNHAPGSDTQVVFNDGGAWGSSSKFIYDKNTNSILQFNITGTNYERGYLRWDSDIFRIGIETGGSGTPRELRLSTFQTGNFYYEDSGGQIAIGLLDQTGSLVIVNESTLWLFSSGDVDIEPATYLYLRGNIVVTETSFMEFYNLNYPGWANFERVSMKWDSNVFKIGTEAGGTGTVRNIALIGGNVDIVGNLTALIEPIAKSGTDTLTAAQCKGQVVYMSAAGTLTLPAVVVGSSVLVFVTTASVVSVDPDAADRIILDGVAGGDGKKITSDGTVGALVQLHGDSANGWTVLGKAKTWTMEA